MPVTYQQAGEPVNRLVAAVMAETFPELKELGVRVDVLMAHAPRDKHGEPRGPAVKLHGVACLATIRVTSLKERVHGLGDCEVILDADRWEELTDRKREALIMHELQHLVPVKDKQGGPKTDDACRPSLKSRPHDVDLGCFFSVVSKYGEDAPETDVYKFAHREFSQRLLPWG